MLYSGICGPSLQNPYARCYILRCTDDIIFLINIVSRARIHTKEKEIHVNKKIKFLLEHLKSAQV